MASLFRAVGLTFKDVGFLKLNTLFPVMTAAAHVGLQQWIKSPGTDAVAAALGDMELPKLPYLVMTVLPMLAVICAIVVLQALSLVAPKGYESHRSREQKAAGNLEAAGTPGWITRLQGAQANTWEACIFMGCTFFVAVSLKLDEILFAKMSTLFLLCRLIYPIVYALDMDFLRTQVWYTGKLVVLAAFFFVFAVVRFVSSPLSAAFRRGNDGPCTHHLMAYLLTRALAHPLTRPLTVSLARPNDCYPPGTHTCLFIALSALFPTTILPLLQ